LHGLSIGFFRNITAIALSFVTTNLFYPHSTTLMKPAAVWFNEIIVNCPASQVRVGGLFLGRS
jgi:hypothetical protein